MIAQELCRFHTVRPEGLEPVCNMWRFGDGLMTFIPEGFPEDPEKHKRYVKSYEDGINVTFISLDKQNV